MNKITNFPVMKIDTATKKYFKFMNIFVKSKIKTLK